MHNTILLQEKKDVIYIVCKHIAVSHVALTRIGLEQFNKNGV
jgi:hypothetical protein